VPAVTPSSDAAVQEESKVSIRRLVEKYDLAVTSGEASRFSEAQVRISFIDPLLRALGWNVESSAEVTVEERLLEGHCDYALRIPGDRRPRVFIEAKRFELGPKGLDGHTERGGHPLSFPQQAIRYAWQSQAEWAVLTNFKETRLYSSYIDPKKPESGLIFTIPIEDFEAHFDQLWTLSKESVRRNALDDLPKKRARETIHVEAPADLFECRGRLASDIHRQDSALGTALVQQAAQRILDRLIVMRVAEDRGVLRAETLSTLHTAWKKALIDPSSLFIKSLRHQFEQFDNVYNSEMFTPGHVCDRVSVSNAVMERVLDVLYDYNFDLIDADILGSIYEGYLSFVLEEEKGELTFHRAESARKSHGVYYTPTYVVEYLVDHALGPALAEAEGSRLATLRVLDPACGSGSFLIKAYDRVAAQYARLNEEAKASAKGRRTIEEHEGRAEEVHDFRDRILRQNLFGVDLDGQAAEIAAINLMLKALRPGQKLPLILKENVRVGNALISADDADLQAVFGEGWRDRRPFRWATEFPTILAGENGGFDAVVGNPPYVDSKAIPESEREYFHSARHGRTLPFPMAYKKTDLYALFLELGIRLLRPGGRLAFIIPDKVLTAPYASKLRPFILDTCAVEQIVDLTRVRVFPRQTVKNVILVLRKEPDSAAREATMTRVGIVPSGTDLAGGIPEPSEEMPQSAFRTQTDCQFRLEYRNPKLLDTALKFERGTVRLEEIFYVNWGLRTGTEEKTRTLITMEPSGPNAKPLLRGEDITGRYVMEWGGQYILYEPEKLINPLFPEALGSPKIVVRKISGNRGLFAAFDDKGLYPFSTVILALPYHLVAEVKRVRVPEGAIEKSRRFDPKYVLAIVNSRATRFYYDMMIADGLSVVPSHVNRLPIPDAPPDVQARLAAHAGDLLRMGQELGKEQRLGSFRRIVSAQPRVGEDDLVRYLDRGTETTMEVRDRLDQVTKASRITVTPQAREGNLELRVGYRLRSSEEERHGTVVCHLEPAIAQFLALVLADREKPDLGSGRPMAKLRAIEIPRFDADWTRHLEIAREVVAIARRHQTGTRELTRAIEVAEAAIDREVYALFGLDETDIKELSAFQPRADEPPVDEDDSEDPGAGED
jgi:type I restriction-modification system DNA methylase subunit